MRARLRGLTASEGYRRMLRWAALPVTDRRWAAPLAAIALGFGLFVGVALGPNAAGTLAGVAQIVEEEPAPSEGADRAETGGEEREGFEEAGSGFGEESFGGEESFEEGGFEEEAGFEFAEAGEEGEPFEGTQPPGPGPEEEGEDSAEESQAVPAAGTVVHVNPAAGSYALVEAGGTLAAVHAKKLPPPGAQVKVPVRTLANGTFVEAGPRKQTGKKPSASFSGIVTWVDADPVAPAYSVSKRGVSLLVRMHPDPTGAPPSLPALGAYASVSVAIEPAPEAVPAAPVPALGAAPLCDSQPLAPPPAPQPAEALWQTKVEADGVPFAYSDFAGIVAAACPADGKLYLSADDTRQGEADVAFAVPKKLSLKGLKPGESVLATAEIGADGALSLKGLAGDEQVKGADDAKATQGDLVNHNGE